MRTARRIGFAAIVLLLLAAAGAWFGGRSVVASRLTASIGLPVEVTSLSVGASSSTVGLRVGDAADPLLTAEEATVAGSPWALADASAVTLKNVKFTLRVTTDDKLKTQFPKAAGGGTIPPIAVEALTIAIHQDGRPAFTVTNIAGTLTAAEGGYKVAGTADDATWGKWTVAGSFVPGGTTTVVLTTPEAGVTLEQLRSIPFIPLDVWDHVRPRGRTGAMVTLEFPPQGRVKYRVQLDVKTADVDVTDIDCPFQKASGGVVIENGVVTLTDVKGGLAAGTVEGGGVLNFVPVPSRLEFKIAAAGLDVKQMPQEWGVSKYNVTGQVRGKLDIDLKVHPDGRLETGGSGAAVVDNAQWNGLPVDIKIRLKPDGPRFRFERINADLGHVSLVLPARPQPPAPDLDAAVEAKVTLKDVDVAELLKKLEVTTDYKLGGKVTVVASIAVPFGQPERTRGYRLKGKFTAPVLTLEGLTLADTSADLAFTEGQLTLTNLKAGFPNSAGRVTGTATVGIDPPGDLTADLNLSRVPLAAVLKALPLSAEPGVTATVDGTANFRSPWPKLGDPAAWTGSAKLSTPAVAFAGLSATDVTLTATLADGMLAVTPAAGKVAGTPATFTGTLGLTKPYSFTATLSTKPGEAADLRPLLAGLSIPFPVTGKLAVDAKATGTFGPTAFTSTGTAAVEDLTVRDSGGNSLQARWEWSPERLKLPEFSAKLFGGTVAGTADVPLTATGKGSFSATFTDLDTAAAGKGVGDIPLTVAGKASGKVAGTFPAGPKAADFTLDLTAEKLTLQGVPTEQVKATVNAANKTAKYKLEGKALGGSFEVTGQYPPGEKGSLRVRGLELKRLGGETLGPLRGTVDAFAEIDGGFDTGTGRATVRGLRWGDAFLAGELSGSLKLAAGQLELVDFGGPFAGGDLRVRGRVPADDPKRNYFTAVLTRADSHTLFAPVPELKEIVTGEVSAVLRGRVGRVGRGSGTLELPRGTLFGFAVAELRVPFDWQSGAAGLGHFTIRESVGHAGSGRLTGDAEYTWGFEPRLDARVKFTDVKLAAVAPGIPAVGGSRFTGKFDIKGENVRSANDLSGNLTGTLNEAAVSQLPVFRQLTPYLSPTGAVAPFQSGEVVARLGKGTFRLERLALSNPGGSSLFADGTINLNKRLDLDVVATIGTVGPAVPILRTLSVALPPIGPVPLVVIREVSRALSNRVIRLHVTGTTDSPHVQLNAAALLSDNAVRYLFSRYMDPFAGVQQK